MPARTPKGRDDLVMGTNSSSIVSKRSVERLYFPDEPQYYRYFVSKFQRRAPLINRGYHLRMLLVDAVVRAFLRRPGSRPKLVVNLGCGSDPLPWRTLSRHADACHGVRFVDVDFPDLMARKRDIVRQTAALHEPLTNVVLTDGGPILLTSHQYIQVACDLRDLAALDAALARASLQLDDADVLFVAEVSITYMEPDAADALVRWAGARPHAEFCLLEQILPDGAASPFAQTMLQHFDKLNTPIKCVHAYPTAAAQEQRFRALGWAAARTWSLWEAWQDPVFLAPADRCRLDAVEAFDEWEEFVHFASHYVLLHARNGATKLPDAFCCTPSAVGEATPAVPTASIHLAFSPSVAGKRLSPRRFGAALLMEDVLGRRFLSHAFGAGTEGRLRSCDLYAATRDNNDDDTALLQTSLHQGGPAARMCFTLTDLGPVGVLLAGGRASPAAPFRDAWLFKKDANRWMRTHDLPVPLFRHAAVRLGASQLALVVGGKTDARALSPTCFVFHPQLGWVRCGAEEGAAGVPLVFGATLLCTSVASGSTASVFHGVLAGGMTADGLVSTQAVRWRLDVSQPATPVIRFSPATAPWVRGLLCRFGAACAQTVDGWTVVAGGVDATGSVLGAREIVRLRLGHHDDGDDDGDAEVQCLDYVHQLDAGVPRPVLVGASLVWTGPGTAAVVGGGMTCFSMGTVWAKGVYSLHVDEDRALVGPSWQFRKTAVITNEAGRGEEADEQPTGGPAMTAIPRVRVDSAGQFRAVLQAGKPVVLAGLDLGGCVAAWTTAYLRERVGSDHPVVVHEAASPAMDFLAKNFRYATQPFGAFLDGVAAGQRLYLRALSAAKPSEQPARLDTDFPGLADDFVLPAALAAVRDNLFSSVLRISGPVTMWLHYDVLANVYCQIRGAKRFCLFPPGDVTQLGFAPGASSSSVDVFALLAAAPAALRTCHPHEAVVGPGDVLFLPPLWLHTAAPVGENHTVAVNVFFRDLEGNAYAAGRDVYGNRDLAAYEKARQDVARMAASLAGLPRDARAFYAARVADELLQLAGA